MHNKILLLIIIISVTKA